MSDVPDAGVAPRRPATANTAWWWSLLVWAAAAAVTCGALWLRPGWSRTPWSADVLAPPFRQLLVPALVVLWLAVIVATSRITRRAAPATMLSLAVLFATTCAWSLTHILQMRWRVLDRCVSPSGTAYAIVEATDGVEADIGLCVVTRSGVLSESLEQAEVEVFYAPASDDVIVPSRIAGSGDWFVEPLDGGDVALFARRQIDGTARVEAFVRAAPGDRRRRVLPFDLFGPEDRGTEAALAAWRKRVREPDALPVDLDSHLMRCLDHPSPWVRDAARDLVRAGGPVTFWQSTRALAERGQPLSGRRGRGPARSSGRRG